MLFLQSLSQNFTDAVLKTVENRIVCGHARCFSSQSFCELWVVCLVYCLILIILVAEINVVLPLDLTNIRFDREVIQAKEFYRFVRAHQFFSRLSRSALTIA